MWPFGKKNVDYDGLALELVRKAAEYQGPTVDACYAFLQATGQRQCREEMAEKKLLNAAAAVIAAEQYVRDAVKDGVSSEHAGQLIDAFYEYVGKLVAMTDGGAKGRVPSGRSFTIKVLEEADHRFPARVTPSSDATHERLTYELVRVVLRLHAFWATGNGDRLELPTAHRDWQVLAEAASGFARASRWIDTSVGPRITKALAN
jgi:hypothetical protein